MAWDDWWNIHFASIPKPIPVNCWTGAGLTWKWRHNTLFMTPNTGWPTQSPLPPIHVLSLSYQTTLARETQTEEWDNACGYIWICNEVLEAISPWLTLQQIGNPHLVTRTYAKQENILQITDRAPNKPNHSLCGLVRVFNYLLVESDVRSLHKVHHREISPIGPHVSSENLSKGSVTFDINIYTGSPYANSILIALSEIQI
jgi:hypothetical protein